jgi:hypothetical protein
VYFSLEPGPPSLEPSFALSDRCGTDAPDPAHRGLGGQVMAARTPPTARVDRGGAGASPKPPSPTPSPSRRLGGRKSCSSVSALRPNRLSRGLQGAHAPTARPPTRGPPRRNISQTFVTRWFFGREKGMATPFKLTAHLPHLTRTTAPTASDVAALAAAGAAFAGRQIGRQTHICARAHARMAAPFALIR